MVVFRFPEAAKKHEQKEVSTTDGTQTKSQSTWKDKNSKARIDVENPAPCKRPGQIHYQDENNKKFLYNEKAGKFYEYNSKTKRYDIEAPKKKMKKLTQNRRFLQGIKRALKYLGKSKK